MPANNTVTDSEPLTPTADLKVTKTDNQLGVAVPGTAITYTVTVSNSGPSTATAATVADTLPASLTSGSVVSAVTAGGAAITTTNHASGNVNDTVTLPSGGSIVYTVTANISPTAAGSLANTATITAPPGLTDPTPANNTVTDSEPLTPTADLKVTKTDNQPGGAVPGTSITYTITVSNSGFQAPPPPPPSPTPLPPPLTGGRCRLRRHRFCAAITTTNHAGGNVKRQHRHPAQWRQHRLHRHRQHQPEPPPAASPTPPRSPRRLASPIRRPLVNTVTDTEPLTPTADLKVTKTDNQAGGARCREPPSPTPSPSATADPAPRPPPPSPTRCRHR